MLQPKKPKYRKQFKGRMHGNSKGGNSLNFGSYGLKALTPARITSRQIESAEDVYLGIKGLVKFGSVSFQMFSYEETCKVRQGKGKGAVEFWAARVKPRKNFI